MPSTLDIRRRIKSIKNTRQITKAMEKISAIKMRKAQVAALKSRRYAALAWDIMAALQGNVEKNAHPLLNEREVKTACFLVISPDKGLCGSLPSRLMQKIISSAPGGVSSENIRWYTIGKKCREGLMRLGAHLEADFGSVPSHPGAAFGFSVIRLVVSDYLSGKIDTFYCAHADFVNTLVQNVTVQRILPLEKVEINPVRSKSPKATADPQADRTSNGVKERTSHFQYVFEPSPKEVLHNLLTRILELQVYQAILENNASEHSARMVAMKNATENASDFIDSLTLEYNQVRQAGITREMAEIAAGRIALEG